MTQIQDVYQKFYTIGAAISHINANNTHSGNLSMRDLAADRNVKEDHVTMFPILLETDDLIAVNKPEGLASIPERKQEAENLLAQLSAMYPHKLYVVHRLDKEVSGVILFAKNAAAHKSLNEQFSHRQVHKTYLAVVHGVMPSDCGVIDAPIRQFGSGRMGIDRQRGKPSQTEFTVQERLGNAAVVRLHPTTGRRHQLRVHLYHLGCPIIGDVRYGDRQIQCQYPRVMLHAEHIAFQALSGGLITVAAPLPDSFTTILDALRHAAL